MFYDPVGFSVSHLSQSENEIDNVWLICIWRHCLSVTCSAQFLWRFLLQGIRPRTVSQSEPRILSNQSAHCFLALYSSAMSSVVLCFNSVRIFYLVLFFFTLWNTCLFGPSLTALKWSSQPCAFSYFPPVLDQLCGTKFKHIHLQRYVKCTRYVINQLWYVLTMLVCRQLN